MADAPMTPERAREVLREMTGMYFPDVECDHALTIAIAALDAVARVRAWKPTNADVRAVEDAVGTGAGAWDIVAPEDILRAAVIRALDGEEARDE